MTDETKKVDDGGPAFPLRMNAYYYSFSPTGYNEIDRILSAVACAGKAFHNTDCWTDGCDPYEGHVGDNPIDWIQNAANDCATYFKSAYAAGIKTERERCLSIIERWRPMTKQSWVTVSDEIGGKR